MIRSVLAVSLVLAQRVLLAAPQSTIAAQQPQTVAAQQPQTVTAQQLQTVAAQQLQTVAAQQPQTVALLDYHAKVPASWASRTPSSTMRLAEYVAGAPGGAEVVVYFFGTSQGGTVDANLTRWKSQFSNPKGGAVEEKVTHDKSGVFPLTIAEYRGTYARGIGAGSAPEAARPNQILTAVVAETPKGTLFFQLFGPVAAVEAQRAAYLDFVRSMK